jgi:hypothetical protein
MKKGKTVGIIAAFGAVGLGLFIFKDQIVAAVKGVGAGAAPSKAPAETGLAGYHISISKPSEISYIDIEVNPASVGKVLNTDEFPNNAPVWIDDDLIGNLNAGDYPLANPGYHLGRAISIPDRYIGTGRHIVTIQIPSVTYGPPRQAVTITYPGGVQKFVTYL